LATVLDDQHWRLVSVVVPLADHAQRSFGEMDRVAGSLAHTLAELL